MCININFLFHLFNCMDSILFFHINILEYNFWCFYFEWFLHFVYRGCFPFNLRGAVIKDKLTTQLCYYQKCSWVLLLFLHEVIYTYRELLDAFCKVVDMIHPTKPSFLAADENHWVLGLDYMVDGWKLLSWTFSCL